MKTDADRIVNVCNLKLPNGFNFRNYQADDIKHWSRIEASVLEFYTEVDANDFIQRAYTAYETELIKRHLFVLNSEGMSIVTANAWYTNSELGQQVSIHWVAVALNIKG